MNTETAPDGRRPLDEANRLEPQAIITRHVARAISREEMACCVLSSDKPVQKSAQI